MTTFFTVLVFAGLTLLVTDAFFGPKVAMKVSSVMGFCGTALMLLSSIN